VRAKFVNESIKDILAPKSREEIRSHSNFENVNGSLLIKYGVKWNDLELIKKGFRKLENSENFSGYGRGYGRGTWELERYLRGIGWKNRDQRIIDLILQSDTISDDIKEIIRYKSGEDVHLVDRNKFYPSLRSVPNKELRSYLSSTGREPQIGFKLYKILEFIDNKGPVGVREIQRFAYEFTHGIGSYDPKHNAGYYCTNIYDVYAKYLRKNEKRKYSLSLLGRLRMKELKAKFSKSMPRMFV